jgi:hypothetical protein
MAIDSGYGSGKPRSAANSASRRTKAASANLRKKNIQRVASKPGIKLTMGEFRRTGKLPDKNQVLESGIGGYGMIAASILKSAARLLKPTAEPALEQAAKISAANQAKFNAAIFNTAARTPAARGAVDKVVRNSVTRAARGGDDSLFIRKTSQDVMRLGDEMSDSFRLQRDAMTQREYDVAHRGIAKILGNMGRVDPVYRQIGRDFRNAATKGGTYKYSLGRKIK